MHVRGKEYLMHVIRGKKIHVACFLKSYANMRVDILLDKQRIFDGTDSKVAIL